MDPYTLFVVDDEESIREGLSTALDPERRGFVDRLAGTEVLEREVD